MQTPFLEAAAASRPGLVSVDGRTYPLESARLAARTEGGLALSRLTQVFANPHEEALKVVYTMPLPAEGTVVGYTIRIGERIIRGVVEPREKAEAAFRKALSEGRSAGLLEQDRDDTFQQRLGNIPPGTKVEVEIHVLQCLASHAASDSLGAQWEYRFPTVVGVRYEGAPGRVPDAQRLDVDRDADGGIPTRLEIDITVAAPEAIHVTSPSHPIFCDPSPDGTHVRFGEGERLDRDLVLHWPACTEASDARLLTGGGLEGDDGRYGLITVTPPSAPAATLTRDLTVLIDASGSMSGEPIEYAKYVVTELLRSLEPRDRFELLAFAGKVRSLTGGMKEAKPEALRRAQDALRDLRACGGTEMAHAIRESLKLLRRDSQHQVVLVTDGQIGFEREVIGGIVNGLPEGCRVHAVGIGSTPNRTLTAGVARAGRGVELLVNDPLTAREGARRLCAATSRPVITGLSIQGKAVRRAATSRLRDVFAGQPLLVAVELRGEGGTLEVRGHLAGSADPWVRRIEVPPAGGAAAEVSETPLPIGALFGREAIADLELTLAAGDLTADGIEAQIELLGMRHHITSRRTSLVAIADEPSVDAQSPKRTERIAVESPAGVSAEGSGLLLGTFDASRTGAFMIADSLLARLGGVAFSRMLSDSYQYQTGAPSGPPQSSKEALLGLLSQSFLALEVRDRLERVEHEVDFPARTAQEGPPEVRIAAEELVGILHRERQGLDRIRAVLLIEVRAKQDLRMRAMEVLARLQEHLDRMRQHADAFARAAKQWAEEPSEAKAARNTVRTEARELEQQSDAYAAVMRELNTLVETGLPDDA